MVQLMQRFSVDDPSLQGGPTTVIPEGKYRAVIVESGQKENKAKTGYFIELKLVITDGPQKDVELIERLNVINPNQTAVKIAFQSLANISKALGMVETPQFTEELHNKPLLIDVKTDPGNSYDKVDPMTGLVKTYPGNPQSQIKGYYLIPAVGFGNQAPAFMQPVAMQQAAPVKSGFAQMPASTLTPPAPISPTPPPAVPAWASPQNPDGGMGNR